MHAFVELHIEQAAVLETHGEPIGVVTAIAAPHDLRLILRGAATHAGATPMALRRDALAGAAEVMTALERLARESASGTTVGTVGVLRLRPGAINVVPGEVELDVDVRDCDLAAREAVVERAARRGARDRRAARPRASRSSRSWRTRRCSATTRWSPPPRPPARSSGCPTGA